MKMLKTIIILGSAFSLVGCENYTSSRLCDGAAASSINLSGTYSMSLQNDNYEVSTKFVDFMVANGTIQRSDTGAIGKICMIDGKTITEYPEDNGFSQSQLVITDSGFSEVPLMYDRPSLEANGITTEVVVKEQEMMSSLVKSVKGFISTEAVAKYEEGDESASSTQLIVHSEGHDPAKVLKSAFPAGFGTIYFRQK